MEASIWDPAARFSLGAVKGDVFLYWRAAD